MAYAEALGEVSTSSSTTADLGGPSVSVTVGPGGLVEVYAFSRGKPDSSGPSALVALGTSASGGNHHVVHDTRRVWARPVD